MIAFGADGRDWRVGGGRREGREDGASFPAAHGSKHSDARSPKSALLSMSTLSLRLLLLDRGDVCNHEKASGEAGSRVCFAAVIRLRADPSSDAISLARVSMDPDSRVSGPWTLKVS